MKAEELMSITESIECPALLLVHGWGGDGGEWEPHRRLWAGRTVLAPDLPGHGRAPAGPDLSPRAMATGLADFLVRRDTGPVVAVGHSMGGQVVTALAVEHPHLVRALVVLDPAYGATAAELRRLSTEQQALRAAGTAWAACFIEGSFGPAMPPAARTRHAEVIAGSDAEVLARCREALYLSPDAFGPRPAARRYLARRPHPVLAVYSNEPAAAWERTADSPTGSRTVVWPDCGHYLHEERPADLVALIDGWTAGW
ncbi:alpha/beta fold hydrolase [Streptomyces sp. AC550_RSS872]|uniref:alpha/beta fold hydrolase n=1 Tax=Streptomyces sp. AC550_RSS872 TaxID=2823689 RepID=UPI001C2765BC|nr:alpha/beta hydrolase [Streptomyces sp. AC550_RSS872]